MPRAALKWPCLSSESLPGHPEAPPDQRLCPCSGSRGAEQVTMRILGRREENLGSSQSCASKLCLLWTQWSLRLGQTHI